MNIWEEFKVEDGKSYFRQVGPLQLWIQRQFDEWKVGWDYKSRDINSISAKVLDKIKENDITWHRKVIMIGQPRKKATKGFARKSFDTFIQLANGR